MNFIFHFININTYFIINYYYRAHIRRGIMIKSNQNHHSKICPSLIQIPKPLNHKKKTRDNINRIRTIGYG